MQSRREDKNGTRMKRIITDFHCLSVSIRTKFVSSVSRLSRGKALTSTLNKLCHAERYSPLPTFFHGQRFLNESHHKTRQCRAYNRTLFPA